MKIAGWIILVIGFISLLGCIFGGSNPFGPIFWIAVGGYLLHRSKQKEKEKEEKEKWMNNK